MINAIWDVREEILKSLGETAYMVIVSLVIAVIAGGLLGLLLFATSNTLFIKNKAVNKITSVILNIIQSLPFLILMIFLLPLSKLIVGTKIGTSAVIVPLSISATAFFARLSESSFSSVNQGVLEAYIASGAGRLSVILRILIPEALSSLVGNITVTTITVLGFSAMSGLVGGGGLGDLAYRYGYQRYQTEIMIACVVILVVLVQVIQWAGEKIAASLNRK